MGSARIQWAVRAHLCIEGSSDAHVGRRVFVLSAARDRAAMAHTSPVANDHGYAVVGLESLSTRQLVPGRTVSGVLA